jgi:hypothetical protein
MIGMSPEESNYNRKGSRKPDQPMNPAIMIIKSKFKQKTITLEQLKEYVSNGTLTKKDILHYDFFPSRRDFDAAFPVTKSEHLGEIRKGHYSRDQIKELIVEGVIREEELIHGGLMTQDQLNVMFERKTDFYSTDFDFSEVPPIREDRTDIFVFGIAGSGKSSFMAGLMYYMNRIGRLDQQTHNRVGYVYMGSLINAVQRRELPKPTAVQYVQHMECDLIDREDRRHPLTFIEMSGELFSNLFGKSRSAMDPKLNEYLFESKNNKVIFLTIDYNAHLSGLAYEVRQDAKFDYILKFLDENGMLNTVESICILITKWDTDSGLDPGAAEKLLKKEYIGLYYLCSKYSDKYKLKFKAFCFSLGRFDATNRYEYDDRYSKDIYEYLSAVTPVLKEEKKLSILRRFFPS